MINGQAGSKISPVYTFGSFRFDPTRGLLTHGAAVTPLPDRLAQLLVLLIHANGDVIDKETIATQIWPDTVVSDGNLSQHMYMLRQLLDERATDRTYLMTVRGKGYRFVASVTALDDPLEDVSAASLRGTVLDEPEGSSEATG